MPKKIERRTMGLTGGLDNLSVCGPLGGAGRLERGNVARYTQAPAVVSFAIRGRYHLQSFPRKRESTPQAIGNAPAADGFPLSRE